MGNEKYRRIDHAEQIASKDISCESLRFQHGTGIAINTGIDRHGNKKYTYRHGIQCNLGDIEESVWKALVKKLIEQENEQELYLMILAWETEHNIFNSSEKEDIEKEALRSYVDRVHDDKASWDYIRFNAKYRPERLQDPALITVVTECCGTPCKVAKEQIRKQWDNPKINIVPCPLCNRGSPFEITK